MTSVSFISEFFCLNQKLAGKSRSNNRPFSLSKSFMAQMDEGKHPQYLNNELKTCLKITNIMFNSPGCAIFREPVDPERDLVPDYYKVIKNPQDIGTIKNRLENNEYTTVNEWLKDMNLVWENAQKYNGPLSFISRVALCMKNKFNKLCRNMLIDRKDWGNKVQELFYKLNITMKSAPGFLKSEFEGKKFSGPMSQSELHHLAEAASGLSDRSDVLQMVQLLHVFGVNLDPRKEDGFVVLKSMPNEAVQALQSFVKDRYKSLHRHYPD
ncbi:Bromodomain containing protein [Tritrichomonas foetus]|uniref:Bromodomain containing protein n=1 Tax=Tritrichomonas foetus TaxID=1144522 RepID=A0A1J4KN85_9EUKA|nr:Bromodomain containing protein [Tritrichomonas foetus]|eukprot:OHT12777.1 Bromodomain containing protein [Tritrichomonas foetus]